VDLVVLVRRDVEERAAFLAGEARRTGIRADQKGLALNDRLVDRAENVGEDRADHEVDLVALQQGLDLGHGDVGFQLVVDDDDLDLLAAHLAAEILDREVEAVAGLLAEHGAGAR
jgi:hypothetical protein